MGDNFYYGRRTSKFGREVRLSDSEAESSDDDTFSKKALVFECLDFNARFNKDFDQRKIYEDTVLKILNEYSR